MSKIQIVHNLSQYQSELKNLSKILQTCQDEYLAVNEIDTVTAKQKKRKSIAVQKYTDAFQNGIRIYEKIVTNQIPDFEGHLPLTKDGYLPKNHKICIWDSNVTFPFPNQYRPEDTLQIYIQNEWIDDPTTDIYTIMTAPTKSFSKEKGYLILGMNRKQRTVSPVLDIDGNLQPITINRATYIKDEDVIPGRIYKQKTGKDMLYLGHFQWKTTCFYGTDQTPYTHDCKTYLYLPVTKNVRTLCKQTKSIPEFLEAHSKMLLSQKKDFQNYSRIRTTPRKFTECVATPFQPVTQPFSICIKINENNSDGIPASKEKWDVTPI